MTVRVAILAATLVVCSHVSLAQANTAARQDPGNTAQVAVNSNNNAGTNSPAGSVPSLPAVNDSTQSAATNAGNSRVENSALEQETAANNGQLPQTSTILPLLGLIGLGSLVAGFFARR